MINFETTKTVHSVSENLFSMFKVYLEVTSAKMQSLRQNVPIFLFDEKVMFYSRDIHSIEFEIFNTKMRIRAQNRLHFGIYH